MIKNKIIHNWVIDINTISFSIIFKPLNIKNLKKIKNIKVLKNGTFNPTKSFIDDIWNFDTFILVYILFVILFYKLLSVADIFEISIDSSFIKIAPKVLLIFYPLFF